MKPFKAVLYTNIGDDASQREVMVLAFLASSSPSDEADAVIQRLESGDLQTWPVNHLSVEPFSFVEQE